FLDALISYITKDGSPDGGLLCIPTHTWASLGDPDPVKLDMNSDKTCVGTLPTLALRRPDAHRSLHPTHSMGSSGTRRRRRSTSPGRS
ncbi:MAG: AAC(3) family N-acetyltransferase, partial [Clostridia bacterium]|nr:AAC(3) family N-acetyltransferase [Clostridia bacterium]